MASIFRIFSPRREAVLENVSIYCILGLSRWRDSGRAKLRDLTSGQV